MPEHLAKANIDLLNRFTKFDFYKERKDQRKIILDESLISSGDIFGIYRLDGIDPLCIMGTGGTIGHIVEALWFEENGERELYLCESQDAPYWPIKRI